MSSDRFFPFHFGRGLRSALRPLGVRPDRDGVWVDHDHLWITYGHVQLCVPRRVIADVRPGGPMPLRSGLGPRRSGRERSRLGLLTDRRRGAVIRFDRPVEPVLGRHPHDAVVVTVTDPRRLADALTRP